MNMVKKMYSFVLIAILLLNTSEAESQKVKYDFVEAMKFEVIKSAVFSKDGKWTAYHTMPDRGDAKGYVKSTENDSEYVVKNGINPQINNNSTWAGFIIKPAELAKLKADKDKPKNGMALVKLADGSIVNIENVKRFEFSEDSRWVAVHRLDDGGKDGKKTSSSDLTIRDLFNETELNINFVSEFAFDSLSNYLAYIVDDPKDKQNGVYVINLKGSFSLPVKIEGKERGMYSSLTWSTQSGQLAYISCSEVKIRADSCDVKIWDGVSNGLRNAVSFAEAPEGWYIPKKNQLRWTEDQNRLFFGFKPYSDTIPVKDKTKFSDSNYYDIHTILKDTELDIWHWNDPRVKTHERKWWDSNKDRVFTAVYNVQSGKFTQLADLTCPTVNVTENTEFALGYDETPYLKLNTWEGFFYDVYAINLNLGTKKLVAKKLSESASLSPSGSYVAYYQYPHWYLYNTKTDSVENLTAKIETPFYDEDNDVPADPSSYGVAGWLSNDRAVVIHDKYDVWTFYTDGGFMNQTALEGRDSKIQFRVVNLDKRKRFWSKDDVVMLSGFDEKTKKTGIFRINFEIIGPETVVFDSKKYRLAGQTDSLDRFLFFRESYDEAPDLWVADRDFRRRNRLSNINDQLEKYNWGKAEIVKWKNYEGEELEGILYKPYNFDSTKKYPMLIWYYERFSQRLHDFNSPYIGHRPAYQVYLDDGYLVFLPDVKFKTGYPGYSALSCIEPGVRNLIKKGFVDSSAVGITGHSWSGYQTAFLVTKTNLFAAAVAGAPVSNMTSAYSGIRIGTGLARQFQYEMGQSRIGGDLWDSLDAYIRNSPVFQAKTSFTPLMIMFGDEDWAVPWQQGQELYLAWRRLNKNCIFLHYSKEPHWPEKFPNRLDYAIRMKEFFDTYCLKKPAPKWILDGEAYKGLEIKK